MSVVVVSVTVPKVPPQPDDWRSMSASCAKSMLFCLMHLPGPRPLRSTTPATDICHEMRWYENGVHGMQPQQAYLLANVATLVGLLRLLQGLLPGLFLVLFAKDRISILKIIHSIIKLCCSEIIALFLKHEGPRSTPSAFATAVG